MLLKAAQTSGGMWFFGKKGPSEVDAAVYGLLITFATYVLAACHIDQSSSDACRSLQYLIYALRNGHSSRFSGTFGVFASHHREVLFRICGSDLVF
jgi:hypothetical protein